MKSKRMERQTREEQSADDPSVDLIRKKYLIAPFQGVAFLICNCMYRT